MLKTKKPDHILLLIIFLLIVFGFFIFSSASLGEAGRDSINFFSIVGKQLIILLVGLLLMMVVANIPYENWKKYAPTLFIAGLILTALVFLPKIGFGWNGARRWLNLGFTTFQPSEFLKLGFVVFLAAWAAAKKNTLKTFQGGLLPFLIFSGLIGALLLKQPDTGTFIVTFSAGLGIFIIAGGRWKHLFLIGLLGLVMIASLAYFKPYIRNRLITFLNPTHDTLGASYQINQSLIAIGSGGLFGRGFGQSIQKFIFLPEPIGDSIFAVAAEEFGLVGASLIVILFLAFIIWGLKISAQISDPFGRYLSAGLVILIGAQSFINIGAMLGVLPLTGVPLVFISHGGTALFFALIEVGIILNISRFRS